MLEGMQIIDMGFGPQSALNKTSLLLQSQYGTTKGSLQMLLMFLHLDSAQVG